VTGPIRPAINYSQSGTTKDHLSLLYFARRLIIRPLPLFISVVLMKLRFHKVCRDLLVATPLA
jgi:hypothetical protein